MDRKKRILTGDRPTGGLHIGHYLGSLQNRAKLQHEYDTLVILADVQALTTNFERPEKLKRDVMNVALDNLAAGLEPDKITMFIQSMIPEIAELTVFYSMFVTVNSLRHNPTIKTEIKQYGYEDVTYGFLGYPISQAADITFCKADLVPVGDDQLPHMELTRKIVRRFNELYKPVLVEPKALLGSVPRLVGLDGNTKMGKSLNNCIYLSDESSIVKQKIFSAITDPGRVKLSDKGNPDVCTLYKYHMAFNEAEALNIEESCRSAAMGCTACKSCLYEAMENILEPVRARRSYYENKLGLLREMIMSGTERTRAVASETMKEIRDAMSIRYFENPESAAERKLLQKGYLFM
ncbi:MAG: tryptophan--tRNA ligase [Bacillota bacterium]